MAAEQRDLESITEVPDNRLYIAYNSIHKLCQQAAVQIKKNRPDIIVAIGGGGFIPARILRSFIKEPGEKNIPIQAIGLSLYEPMGEEHADKIGKEVIRTQWLDFNNLDLVGKKILIVDEVDDSRTTLHYALSELEKDVRQQEEKLRAEKGNTQDVKKTTFSIFVLHNKDKPKRAHLPQDMMDSGRYIAAITVKDAWIAYPWDAMDVDLHTRYATLQGNI